MNKFILNIISYIFIVIGLVYIISYLNLLDIGYNFKEYVYFIIRRAECLIFLIGIIILFINLKRRK